MPWFIISIYFLFGMSWYIITASLTQAPDLGWVMESGHYPDESTLNLCVCVCVFALGMCGVEHFPAGQGRTRVKSAERGKKTHEITNKIKRQMFYSNWWLPLSCLLQQKIFAFVRRAEQSWPSKQFWAKMQSRGFATWLQQPTEQ